MLQGLQVVIELIIIFSNPKFRTERSRKIMVHSLNELYSVCLAFKTGEKSIYDNLNYFNDLPIYHNRLQIELNINFDCNSKLNGIVCGTVYGIVNNIKKFNMEFHEFTKLLIRLGI